MREQGERHDDEGQDAEDADDAVGRLAGDVAERADGDRPSDAAEGVEDRELAPLHVARPGHPRGRDAQHRQPAPEEHGLAAVAAEEDLAALDGPLQPVGQTARPGDMRRRKCRPIR